MAGASVNATGAPSSVVNAAVVAAAQQQHAVHHSQSANTQASTLNHTGWSPGIAPQAHHAVVTDHSTLAYMTHAYQSHGSSVNDHHRNSNAPMANQPIGTGPQASSYTVDTLYNTPAAAAAVAAYGYNNYNAAFFQTSSNGPHAQTGHPSPAGLSGFWNQNQQQRTTHSQAVSNQASIQQRQQQMASEQPQNYMHDPRLYYGRPAYGQGMQNFGQHHSQAQPQNDVVHHRMTAISQQQPQLVQQHDQQIHQMSHQQNQQLHHSSALTTQQSQTNQNTQQHLNQQPHHIESQPSTNQASVATGQNQQNKKLQPMGVCPQHRIQKQSSNEADVASQPVKNHLDIDQFTATNQSLQQSNLLNQKAPQQPASKNDNSDASAHSVQPNTIKDAGVQQTTPSSLSPVNKSQSVIKSDSTGQYQSRKPNVNTLSQAQGRNTYRAPTQDDRAKSQVIEPPKKPSSDKDQRLTTNTESAKNQSPPSTAKQQESDQQSSLDDSMATLAISARKTTWASIASQPAKVSQPKSLKSKIAGSNSVLSSAKHLTSVSSMESSSMESKNGINPAIKSSVSTAATSIQRSSVPPPISKVAPTGTANLKLDLLGENAESTKISWPAVNASINLTLDPILQKEKTANNSQPDPSFNDKQQKGDENFKGRELREQQSLKDHNQNQGPNTKMVNNYQSSHSRREDRREEYWHRREQRDYHRARRDSDRKEPDYEKKTIDYNDNHREQASSRRERDTKLGGRLNQFRGSDEQHSYRDRDHNKRGAMLEHNERGNDSYHNSRFPQNRYYHPRDSHQSNNHPSQGSRQHNSNESAPHHHYNNVRDGNSSRNPQTKPDLNLHPHLNPANFNPKNFNCEPENARYFIIKSYSEDDIHRSIKYSIWCSTNHGNRRLDEAYRQQQAKNGQLFLFFSVNGSGHFCGMAQMMSVVDFDSSSGVWAQSKWQGEFSVKWIYVKDVPNSALRHITLENNEDKPVTNSRDTQEVPSEKGKAVLKILHQYNHTTSIFDDFLHYERRQEEEKLKKSSHLDQVSGRSDDRGGERDAGGGARFNGRPYMSARSHNDFQGNRERPSRFAS